MKKDQEIFDSQLILTVTLSDLESSKSKKYLDLLHRSMAIFDFLKMRVVLCIPDHQRIKAEDFEVIASTARLEQLKALKWKTIYGTQYEIVYSYLFLMQDGKIVEWKKRISKKSIFEICQKANTIRYKEISKNLQNLFDNSGGYW